MRIIPIPNDENHDLILAVVHLNEIINFWIDRIKKTNKKIHQLPIKVNA